ncbi:hypothetical protein A6V36_14825 [Paraburkholderia ginsengiterrae]|uniref:Uncharacterized protein n=1 Tax=Paraburkholderia ginsengiterrae TaxID=1462993 RepID=A0A1A9N849_9BURK|nr:hypothetical protein [Paraburkholderia ginsengiterrae]OAJ51842.1 hypothetical protein A6V36_14825 [Paraburkholderia ginsengiterrae]OAJ59950.1 hypothetical protein A6V37_26210 [Paraburkholderia ginsengiterrae]
MKKLDQRMVGQLGCFVQTYARKAHAGYDPNDRRYDKQMEEAMQRLRPVDFSDLLSGDGELDAAD